MFHVKLIIEGTPQEVRAVMSQDDQLTSVVAAIAQAASSIATDVQNLIAAVQASGNNDPAVAAAVTSLQGSAASFASSIAEANTQLNPTPTPTPTGPSSSAVGDTSAAPASGATTPPGNASISDATEGQAVNADGSATGV